MPWNRISDLDRHWDELTWKFECILNGEIIKQEDWFLCFTEVFQLLTSVDTDSLDRIHEKLYGFFKNYLMKLSKRIESQDDSNLLVVYRSTWVLFRENLLKISQVFGTLLFEPYRSSSMLPSALYLPSLSNHADEIQSDADIASVYDIGVLYWQNLMVKPNSDRLLRVLMKAVRLSWDGVIRGETIMESSDSNPSIDEIVVDVALTFSQRPGELFAAIRNVPNTASSEQPISSNIAIGGSVASMINPANLLNSIKSTLTGESGITAGVSSPPKSSETPAIQFVLAYQQLIREFALMSRDLDISKQSDAVNCRRNITQLSRFVASENSRVKRIFGPALASDQLTLMEDLFVSGERKQAIEKFLSEEANSRGLCNEVAELFGMISVLPSGRKMAISVLAQYISGLSKIILKNRPADVTSSPESFVNYFGGQLMQLRKTVEVTFSADNMSDSLAGAVVRAAEEVLSQLSSENLCPEDYAARYIDIALKKTPNAEPNNVEFQKKLDAFIGLFTYLTEKTLYQKNHAKLLFRRLILGLSPSIEVERSVHRCMADICSPEYCVYLNRTVAEVERSAALSKDYASYFQETTGCSTIQAQKLNAVILSQHIWPLGPPPLPLLKVPGDFHKHLDEFSSFFKKKKERAKLTWVNGYATAEIRLLYPSPKPVTIVALMGYVSVLLTFSEADSRSASWLAEQTGLSIEELARVCSTLTDQKLLLPASSSPTGETIYSLNLQFTSKHPKIRLLSYPAFSASSYLHAPSTPKSPQNLNSSALAGDSSMDLDQSRGSADAEPVVGRSRIIEKLVVEAKDHVQPSSGFTCMDILRCVLARPELNFTPTPNEIHLCLQRLAAMGQVLQLSHNGHPAQGVDNSHQITYRFA